MKLEIDLTSREEIDAAVSLLHVLQANTEAPHACTGSGNCRAPEGPGIDLAASAEAARLARLAGKTPAEVFTPLPSGVPAPSTAGAVPLPTAREVPLAATSTATPSVPVPPAPTPAPAAAVPSAPAAPTTPAPAVELDAKGLPWDERIHASSKAKISDGTWRMKKQVDPALVATVEAELRGRMAATAPADGWPFAQAAAPAPEVHYETQLPSPPTELTFSCALVDPADPTTFEQLMPRITAAVTAGTLPAHAVGAACAAAGLASVVALQMSPQHVPQVWAALKQQYPSLA